MRWKAQFFLKPETKPTPKETYGFKSITPAPTVPLLKPFEDGLTDLVKNVKFGRKPNHFQQQLKKEEKKIKSDPLLLIKADKSNNYYKMESEKYNELLEKEIQKEYKKVTPIEIKNIESEQKNIVKKLELQDRVFATTRRQAFATLKDHKPNFQNNPKVRLINSSKPEIGRIAKKTLENINTIIRKKSGLNQWQNNTAVIEWFKNIKRKKSNSFIKFDVVNFYPSISRKLLIDALKWARNFVTITPDEENWIIEAKNSLLFKDGTPWAKKGDSFFDVAQGSYDVAETCELVGLFILEKISKIQNLNVGIYRDDGLACTTASPRQAEK